MDVLSLPSEMLTLVLKYAESKLLQKVRSMNYRIDEITRRHRLNGAVLDELCMWNDPQKVHIVPKQNFYNFNIKNRTISNSRKEKNKFSNILNDVLSKVRKIDTIFFYNLIIDEDTINIILQHASVFRNASLIIYSGPTKISNEQLKNFANFLKLSEIWLTACDLHNQLTDETLLSFNLTMNVILSSVKNASSITARSLNGRVYGNTLKLDMGRTESSITFNDMVKFLKNFNPDDDINFGILCDVPTEAGEIERVLNLELGAEDFIHETNYFSFELPTTYGNHNFMTFQIPLNHPLME